jgi:hypothetical protein
MAFGQGIGYTEINLREINTMSKITLDAALRSKLNGLNETLVVCDENGQTVGHFLPAETYRKLLFKVAESQCPYTPEQLQALRQETGGLPLADLWKTLGQP